MVLLSSKNEWEIVNSSLYILLLLIFWSSIYLVKECVRERVKSVEKEERWLASSQTNSSDYGKLSEIPDIGRHFVTARVSVGPNQHRGRSWARVRASSALWGQFITAITAGADRRAWEACCVPQVQAGVPAQGLRDEALGLCTEQRVIFTFILPGVQG